MYVLLYMYMYYSRERAVTCLMSMKSFEKYVHETPVYCGLYRDILHVHTTLMMNLVTVCDILHVHTTLMMNLVTVCAHGTHLLWLYHVSYRVCTCTCILVTPYSLHVHVHVHVCATYM